MSNTIERAKSGRAKCRKCKEKIEKDELRFGHMVDTQFGETLQWYHIKCAAEKAPIDLEKSLTDFTEVVPDRDEIDKLIAANRKKQKPSKMPYAEFAPTGRSSCIACGDKIEKGEYRVAIEREIDAGGFARTGAGYLHPHCVQDCEDAPDDTVDQVAENSTSLDPPELEEVQRQIVDA